jgi:excisionase family DNA binding protein
MSVQAASDKIMRAQEVPRLALTVTEAAESIGVSLDFFAEHVAGDLRMVRRGRKKLVSVRELETWLERNSACVLDEVRS